MLHSSNPWHEALSHCRIVLAGGLPQSQSKHQHLDLTFETVMY